MSTFFKNLLILLIFTACGSSTTSNKTTQVKVDVETIQLNNVLVNTARKCTFTLTNTGDEPLRIYNVETSCGCTNASWDKKPVKPGKTCEVSITYQEKYPGRFYKTITVFANSNNPIELHIEGEVVDPSL